jgi:hypothetical protein
LDQAEIEEAVKELETRVDRLRSLYEQYFMGIEKLEPGVPKKDVERRVQMLRKEQIRNTALRFRFQMVLQRYNTYQSYWQRICRQIEEGTYKRDILRAKARQGDEAKKKAATVSSFPVEMDMDEDFSDMELEEIASAPPPPLPLPARPPVPNRPGAPPAPPPIATVAAAPAPPAAVAPVARAGFGTPPKPTQSRLKMLAVRLKAANAAAPAAAPSAAPAAPAKIAPRTPPPPAPRTPPPPPPRTPAPPPRPAVAIPAASAPRPAPAAAPAPRAQAAGDLSDERVRQLYSQYVDTKRKQNESTASITYDNLARTLRESSAKLKEKHAGKNVDFEVTVKDGKTILKPVVKEGSKK